MKNGIAVATVGGGPAESTAGTLLNKHDPKLSVTIFERERFPRDPWDFIFVKDVAPQRHDPSQAVVS